MKGYPDIEDSEFQQNIGEKYKKYTVKKKNKSLAEICYPKKYQLQLPQLFLAEYINPKTPYKSVLVYHNIGAGKTCAAVSIAENFIGKKKIMVVLPASLIGNFRSELRSPCAGNKYISKTDQDTLKKYPSNDSRCRSIIDKSNKKIDKVYTIYSYNAFIDLVQLNKIKLKNTLLIIDEVHNMVSSDGLYYEQLYELVHKSPDDMRLVIMTATPIFDKPVEIALTMNLLLRDKQMPVDDFNKKFLKYSGTEKNPVVNVVNMEEFKSYTRGYISYFRGAPASAYPSHKIIPVKLVMSEHQYDSYRKIEKKSQSKNTKSFPNSFLIGTRMASNIAYPNGKKGEIGEKSMNTSDYKLEKLKKFSPKFVSMYEKIIKCKGTVFVYSNFKDYGGIKSFAKVLEHHNFLDYEKYGSGKMRFAIWSSDQSFSIKEEIKETFNNPANVDGSMIKIILGTPSIKEGVSLLRVRQAHLMDPYWNMSRMNQVIGRVIRYCSHKDVPEKDMHVDVYIYMATHPKLKKSTDQRIMELAIEKDKINKKFVRALKESALDCELFKNGNIEPGEKPLKCS
jgi:superfamily II DNA or RNA helicase